MPTIRIGEFDTWRPGYGQATVRVLNAGTTVLASIYLDEALTLPAANPQTLLERIDNEISYGRFAAPVYVGSPYQLAINTVDRTAIIRPPLITLDGEDASAALVRVSGGSEDVALADIMARSIDVRDFGEWKAVSEQGASTATNTATFTAAIGAAGGRGGGFVQLPAGTYQVSTYTVPQGVVVRGYASDATFLRSTQAGQVAIIGGDRAGFSSITLDGVTLVVGSIGVFSAGKNGIVLDDVVIQRFETGLRCDGGTLFDWRNLRISQCTTGYRGYGEQNDTVTAELRLNQWQGGKVELCTTAGIALKHDGQDAIQNLFAGIHFDTNTGTALKITGALASSFPQCRWSGNTTNLDVSDASASAQVVGLELIDGTMDTGAVLLTGRLENVAIRRMRLANLNVTITTPGNNILIEDCEESGIAISGESLAWLRHETGDDGATFGETTGNAETRAWAITLDPGDMVYLEAKVLARRINGVAPAFYHFAVSARRPGATLNYDTQTGNFTPGHTLSGATSGATAVIQADTDAGVTGTLTLIDVVGTFVDNEIITDGFGGSAMANGAYSVSDAVLAGSVTDIRAPQETDANYAATFVANGPQIELHVTGDTAHTVEWTCDVIVTRN